MTEMELQMLRLTITLEPLVGQDHSDVLSQTGGGLSHPIWRSDPDQIQVQDLCQFYHFQDVHQFQYLEQEYHHELEDKFKKELLQEDLLQVKDVELLEQKLELD